MKKLLVIRYGALGDLIHVSPSLAYLHQQDPDLEIHFLTSPAYETLVQRFEGVKKVWTYDKQRPWQNLFALIREFQQVGIDGVINLHPSFKTWFLSTALRTPLAVYHKDKLSVKGAQQRLRPRRHAVEDFYEPFSRLFRLPQPANLIPRLSLEKVWGRSQPDQLPREILSVEGFDDKLEHYKPPSQQWVGIIPGVGNKRSNRAWGITSYQALIQVLLVDPSLKVLLVGGPDERALADTLELSERVENHCGQHNILRTAALLAQCDVVIGADTGPTHVAAAVGVPIISLFGPTSIARTGPRGHGDITNLIPPETLACWPCELTECPLMDSEYLACMKQIEVEAVLSACKNVLLKGTPQNSQQKTSC